MALSGIVTGDIAIPIMMQVAVVVVA